jgi:hypothetical protein
MFRQSKLFKQVLDIQYQQVQREEVDLPSQVNITSRSQGANSFNADGRTLSNLFVEGASNDIAQDSSASGSMVGLQNNLNNIMKMRGTTVKKTDLRSTMAPVQGGGPKKIEGMVRNSFRRFQPLPSPKGGGAVAQPVKTKKETEEMKQLREAVQAELDEFDNLTTKQAQELLEGKVHEICAIDPYIGCVAQSEIKLCIVNQQDEQPVHL